MSQEFRDAVRERSHIRDGLVIVDTFVNHKIDPILMRSCGEWLARELGQADVVVTSEASGIAPALAAATALGVPMVFAKKRPEPSEGSIARQVVSPTKGDRSWLEIKPHVLDGIHTAVVIDDFLSAGRTALTLSELLSEAGVQILGLGFAIEKTWTGGRKLLEEHGFRVVSAVVVEMNEEGTPVVA
ncbi:MAG TPA: phosphoribosyltransferase family protein [Acidimicrobiia bacterium]|jgi:xanthine phosphoribosyltransferase